MAASTTLPGSPPEERNNPGEEEYRKLVGDRPGSDNYEQGQQTPVGNPTDPRGNDTAAGDDSDPRGDPSLEDLKDREEASADGSPSHSFYRKTGQGTHKTKGRFSLTRRRKWGLGIGGGLIGGGLIALMLLFLPALRLEGYLSKINQRVFAAADSAVSNRVSNLFDRYMVTKILTMQRCGAVVTNTCRNDYSQAGFAKDLFNSWQDARVENKLIEKYGLEVQSYKSTVDGKERFKIIDKQGRFGKPGDELTIKDGKLVLGKSEGGPRIFGRDWNLFLKNETRWDQVLQRRSIRKYLVRKHGTKFWCLFACTTKDSIDNAKVSAKTKLKYKLIERTVFPFSQKYGLILKCLSSGDTNLCNPDNLEKNGIDRRLFSNQDLADLKTVSDSPNSKLSQILLEKLLLRMGIDEGAAKAAASAVPFVGQIYLGLSAIDTLETVKISLEDGTLSKIAANVASDQYVEYYTAMRSVNDELKAGKLSADEAGALVSQFDDGDQPAEQSLVYQAYTDTGSSSVAFASGKVYAATTTAPTQTPQTQPYLCSDGKPIPAGQLVCSDKTLNKRAFAVESYYNDSKSIIDILDAYNSCPTFRAFGLCVPPTGRDIVHPVLKKVNYAISGTLGNVLGAFLTVLKHTPGIGGLMDSLNNEAGKIVNRIFTKMFPLPLSPDSPGREKYDALEAGGEVTASEFGQGGYTDSGQPYGLGGKLLSDQEAAGAAQVYLDQQNYDNSHSSLITRVASIDNPHSLLSRFVAVMPTSRSQFFSRIMSIISKPFSGLGAIWHPAYAAANTASINAFGIDRFGYKADDPVFTADPSIYTPQYCDEKKKEWQGSMTQNQTTGADEYSTTNPCLLEQVSVEAASSAFTQNDSVDQ